MQAQPEAVCTVPRDTRVIFPEQFAHYGHPRQPTGAPNTDI